jgi:organic radical activating enzyme
MYLITETFYSLQGEGFFAGIPAYFIRLAGCKNHCEFCDTKETWNAANGKQQTAEELAQQAFDSGAKTVVITGGEPMLYEMQALCDALKARGLKRHLETSGSEKLSGEWDWITLSPKPNITVHKEFYEKANEIKIVIANKKDFAFAEEQASQIHQQASHINSNNTYLLLQPEWNNRVEITPAIINYIKQNPKWRLSLQTHKYLEIQ